MKRQRSGQIHSTYANWQQLVVFVLLSLVPTRAFVQQHRSRQTLVSSRYYYSTSTVEEQQCTETIQTFDNDNRYKDCSTVRDDKALPAKSSYLTSINGDNTIADLPPWLDKYHNFDSQNVKTELGWLEFSLIEHGFEYSDIQKVTNLITIVGSRDTRLVVGIIDFLRLMLSSCTMIEHGEFTDQDEVSYNSDNSSFVTVSVLLASILHYTECITAQRQGMTKFVAQLVRQHYRTNDSSHCTNTILHQLPQKTTFEGNKISNVPVLDDNITFNSLTTTGDLCKTRLSTVQSQPTTTVSLDESVLRIAHSAARIKRAEILAQAVQGPDRVLTADEASRLIGWLLTMTMNDNKSTREDWQALVIRVVASLYRVNGLLQQEQNVRESVRSPQAVQTAREAMRVYSVIASQLGMHRLKSSIQESAFKILYQRQYKAVSSLYRQNGGDMVVISHILRTHITRLIEEDESLISQLDTVQVASRVKEPFSFWKKMLKKKKNGELQDDPFSEIQDIIALRVILEARKTSEDEVDEETKAREKFLCYYVQDLIRDKWPELDATRIKDYISMPKRNGYESLHHTSQIVFRGIQYPFEIQVRSRDMHSTAEYGVAAHWDYKLGNTMALQQQDSSSTNKETSMIVSKRKQGSYISALVEANNRNQKVYVFVVGGRGDDEGQLVSLPKGSVVGNAVSVASSGKRSSSSSRIDNVMSVWKNGIEVSMSDEVTNGDVVVVKF